MTSATTPSRKRFGLFALLSSMLVLTMFSTLASAQATRIRFSLDWIPNGAQAPFFLAKNNGYFEKEGLDVSIDSGNGSTAFIQRLTGGAYDIAVGDMGAFIEHAGNNPADVQMQAIYVLYNAPLNAMFALKKSGITKPADLANKSIAGATFASTRKLWPLFAKSAGINAASVNWVSVDPSLRETMLMRGDVAAVAGFTTDLPIYANLGIKREDVIVMSFADQGIKQYSNTLIARTQFLKENPAAVKAFLRALTRAYKETIANPKAAMQALLKRDPLLKEAPELQRLEISLAAVVTPETQADGLGGVVNKRLTAQVDDLQQVLAFKTKPSPERLFNPSFLPDAEDRRISR